MGEIQSELALVMSRAVPELDWGLIQVLSLDCDDEGRYHRLVGLRAAAAALRIARSAENQVQAILLVGMLSNASVANAAKSSGTEAGVLDWPGLAYLQLPFSKEVLRQAAVRILMGRHEPLPAPDQSSMLQSLKSVLHWFERVKQGQAGTARVFSDAKAGRLSIGTSILSPAPCLSLRQRRAIEELVIMLASIGGEFECASEILRDRLRRQDESSEALERLKAQSVGRVSDLDIESLSNLAVSSRELASRCGDLHQTMKDLEMQLLEAPGTAA